jgi:hypothetical protein
MTENQIFITLTPEVAKQLAEEIQAVLNGDASYFHTELSSDDGRQIGIHLGGPDDE